MLDSPRIKPVAPGCIVTQCCAPPRPPRTELLSAAVRFPLQDEYNPPLLHAVRSLVCAVTVPITTSSQGGTHMTATTLRTANS
jgi:hypothetical protein